MMRKTLLGLAALTAAFAVDAAPASAQGYRLYPWCAQYSGRGGSNCYFSTYSQCREAVSGVGGVCVQNTFYTAYGSYYSFGGAEQAPRGRRMRQY